MAFIEGNGVLIEAHMVLGQKNQLKQHYRFLLKVYRRPSRKKMSPFGIYLDFTKAYDMMY
jgi:hypothetical protein